MSDDMIEANACWYRLMDEIHKECEAHYGHPVERGSKEWQEFLRVAMPSLYAEEMSDE